MARIHRTAASQFARDLVNIVEEAMGNVGKRTPSDPMETGSPPESIGLPRVSNNII